MTLIECFDQNHGENIAACLRLAPQRLILLGDREQMQGPARRYEKLLRQRRLPTRLELQDLGESELWQTVALLEGLLEADDQFVIDLTGGEEQVLMAVGAVLARLTPEKRRQVSVQRIDPETGECVDCDGDGRVISHAPQDLTVEELIALYGGTIHPSAYQPEPHCSPRQLAGLWELVAADPKGWNRKQSVLGEFESRSDSKMQVYLPLKYLRGTIHNFSEKEALLRQLLWEFDRRGIITDQSSASALEYTYTSQLLRYSTQKAGNVLEAQTLLQARRLRDGDKPYFRDCRMGVSIDWDGIVHTPAQRVPDTRNEMDLILTKGLTPLFVSCKNGGIGEEELYKLHTVAQRFGGPYARKMLIATDLDQKAPAADSSLIRRAKDMGIYMVENAGKLSGEGWQKVFREAMGETV